MSFLTTGDGLKILTPFNYALVKTPDLTIIGSVKDSETDSVTLRLNGELLTFLPENKIFHAVVHLKEGENAVVLPGGMVQNIYYQAKTQKIHRPPEDSKIPGKYLEYQFHSNLPQPECLSCHKLGPEVAGLPDCYEKCHTRVFNRSWGHGPTGEFRCLACHDPFGDQTGYSMILTGKELCFSCHSTMVPTKPFVHGAVKQGLCLGCHDPHSTDYKKVLRYDDQKLCYTCHEIKTRPQQYRHGKKLFEGDNFEEYEFPHPPVVDGQCLYCHEPHESNYKANLKKAPTILCTNYDCHGTLKGSPIDGKMAGHMHPFDKDPKLSIMAKVPKEIKLDENQRVVCYSCHTPHGSNRDSFLIEDIGQRKRGEKLCGKCHPPVDTLGGGEINLSIEREDK